TAAAGRAFARDVGASAPPDAPVVRQHEGQVKLPAPAVAVGECGGFAREHRNFHREYRARAPYGPGGPSAATVRSALAIAAAAESSPVRTRTTSSPIRLPTSIP